MITNHMLYPKLFLGELITQMLCLIGFYIGSGHGRGPSPILEDSVVRDQLADIIPEPVGAQGLADGLCTFLSV